MRQTIDTTEAAIAAAPGRLRAAAATARLPWFVTGLALPLLGLSLAFPERGLDDLHRIDRVLTELKPVFSESLLASEPGRLASGGFGHPEDAVAENTVTLNVRSGDTLEQLFRREQLDSHDMALILAAPAARDNLRILRPGDEIRVRHKDGAVQGLSRSLDTFTVLEVTRAEAGFDAELVKLPYSTRTNRATGFITSSLFQAAASAGISDATIMKLASIFASEIDFVLDLREGDQFTLIYEEMWRDGERLGDGDVLAAEFMSQGKVHRAVRFESCDGQVGYYTPTGESLRRAWVRAPLAFSRVSSNFNPRRRHPILNTIRAHTGVDYAAPTGTPVRAPADGKVSFRGRKGGYGNAIILQHSGGITTLYAHLSGFGKVARHGARVKQGDVIGYVGATGLATAPHLHYEYRVNGRYLNPRTVRLPDGGVALQARDRAEFQRTALPLMKRLDAGRSMLADVPNRARPSAG